MITGMVVGMMHIRVVCQGLTVVEPGRAEDGDHTTEDMTVEMEGLRMGKMDMVVSQVQKLRTHQEEKLFLVVGLTVVAVVRECSHKQEEVALGGPVGGSLVVHSIVFFYVKWNLKHTDKYCSLYSVLCPFDRIKILFRL